MGQDTWVAALERRPEDLAGDARHGSLRSWLGGQALAKDGELVKLEFTDVEGRFTLPLEPGTVVDLLAAPPPEDPEFYEFTMADMERSTTGSIPIGRNLGGFRASVRPDLGKRI